MSSDFSFNPPPFDNKPVVIATMWTLTKDQRTAVCELVNHPSRRAEMRCVVDGETYESNASNDALELFEQSDA
jgi:hypothetical protein